ncbi:MAG: ABC transporter substrate-binding protein [Nitrososphaerales archaeon]
MTKAISRIAAIGIVVILIVVAAVGAYAVVLQPKGTGLSSTSQTSSGSSSLSTSSLTSLSTLTNSTQNSSSPKYGGTLIADETFEPGTIDPSTTNTVAGLAIDANVLDTLVTYNWTTKTIVPRLALNWTVSPDQLTYTFSLRQGVYFVNPTTNATTTQFNATDVQYSWNRVLPQANGYVFATAGINMSTFKIITPFEFSVSLNAPFSAFLPTIADYLNAIISSTADLAHGGVQNGTVNAWAESNLIGTGPYVMSQWVKGDHITLVRNPYYWGPKPYLNSVIIYYKNDASTRLLDIKGGAVQVANIDPNLLSQLQGSSNIAVKTIGLSDNIAPIGFNVHKFPTNLIDVRLAISHAINYSFIDQSIFDGYAIPFAGPFPKGMFGYNNSIAPYQYNLTLAKSEMAAAGFANGQFSNGSSIPPINFVYPFDWPSGGLVAGAIQSDLSAIGLQVNIEGATSVTYGDITSLNFTDPARPQMLAYFWTPDYNDPADYATPSAAYSWNGGFSNSTIEALGTQALHTSDQTQRASLYSQIQVLTMAAAPVVWTYQYVGFAVYQSNVQGLIYNPLIDGYGFEWQTVWMS